MTSAAPTEPMTPRLQALRRCEQQYDLLASCLEIAELRHAATLRGGDWGALVDNLRGCLEFLTAERAALLEARGG